LAAVRSSAGPARPWKQFARDSGEGYFSLSTEDTKGIPVRLFLTPNLLDALEDNIYSQIVNAASFPGVKLVAITPDVHYGYGVPVGCVILTDATQGAVAMGPVGYDIGCFAAETPVPLLDGTSRPIRDLAKAGGVHQIYALSPQRQVVAASATARLTRRNAVLIQVHLDKGPALRCTPDHRFMRRDGGWLEAAQLEPGTALMPFDSRQVSGDPRVLSVEPLNVSEDVYCLTVPGFENFAIDAGVFVHNCGMMSARSSVPISAATPEKRLEFNRNVQRRIALGPGQVSRTSMKMIKPAQFEHVIREGAAYYVREFGERVDRAHSERDFIPVDDQWAFPAGGKGRPERGIPQLGTLGGGNHFIELQANDATDSLYVQMHSGSRGFGHGLATNYFERARIENPAVKALDLGYFTPESGGYRAYLNAVAAGANFAIVNRLVMFEQLSRAFEEVFGSPLELVYEISHNLVQREHHPESGWVHVHRKGATRAFPKGYDDSQAGHPVLIPGSNRQPSFILRAAEHADRSGYSVNHGAGRRMSRGRARRELKQDEVDRLYREAGILVNTDGRVPIDESEAAYKPIKEVIDAVVQAGLATVEHELRPLASIKGTE
jgi:tRNA-splicing ligase RtcB (3'-phosphate/5'-hydroxy nucleic acid ligase)